MKGLPPCDQNKTSSIYVGLLVDNKHKRPLAPETDKMQFNAGEVVRSKQKLVNIIMAKNRALLQKIAKVVASQSATSFFFHNVRSSFSLRLIFLSSANTLCISRVTPSSRFTATLCFRANFVLRYAMAMKQVLRALMSTKKMSDGINSIMWILQKSPETIHKFEVIATKATFLCPVTELGTFDYKEIYHAIVNGGVKQNLQIGIADTMNAFPQKSADDLVETFLLKSFNNSSSSFVNPEVVGFAAFLSVIIDPYFSPHNSFDKSLIETKVLIYFPQIYYNTKLTLLCVFRGEIGIKLTQRRHATCQK